MPAARSDRIARSWWRRRHAWPVGLTLYPEGGVQRVDVQVGFGQQLLQLVVLRLQLTQAPRIGHLHATVLGTPLVEGGVAKAALAAQLLDRQAGLGLLDETDDLLLGVSALSHVRHSPS